jgi:hypothetical protein
MANLQGYSNGGGGSLTSSSVKISTPTPPPTPFTLNIIGSDITATILNTNPNPIETARINIIQTGQQFVVTNNFGSPTTTNSTVTITLFASMGLSSTRAGAGSSGTIDMSGSDVSATILVEGNTITIAQVDQQFTISNPAASSPLTYSSSPLTIVLSPTSVASDDAKGSVSSLTDLIQSLSSTTQVDMESTLASIRAMRQGLGPQIAISTKDSLTKLLAASSYIHEATVLILSGQQQMAASSLQAVLKLPLSGYSSNDASTSVRINDKFLRDRIGSRDVIHGIEFIRMMVSNKDISLVDKISGLGLIADLANHHVDKCMKIKDKHAAIEAIRAAAVEMYLYRAAAHVSLDDNTNVGIYINLAYKTATGKDIVIVVEKKHKKKHHKKH